MESLIDEIRHLSDKLAEFKQLYYVQRRERELAGEKFIALQDDFDNNKQVFHHCLISISAKIAVLLPVDRRAVHRAGRRVCATWRKRQSLVRC